MEEVGSGHFYLDDIYEDDPAYVDGFNKQSDSDYNASDKFPDADDIEKYGNLIGDNVMFDSNTGDNKNIASNTTVKIRVLDNFGKPFYRVHADPLPYTREYGVELEDGSTYR